MSYNRRQKREFSKHMDLLSNILGKFYGFLSKEDTPSNDEIRDSFRFHQNLWIQYCKKKNLSKKIQQEFNHQVAETWKHKQNVKK